jgi:flagellin-like hook-associated protein FlgL
MNSNDLKKTLRPLVKQLVKEAMQEELTTVISEIIKQTSSVQMVEQRQVQPQMNKKLQEDRAAEKQKQIEERRKRLEEFSKNSFGGMNLFEGTTPTPAPRDVSGTKGAEPVASPLAGVDPSDSGVDISGLLKMTGGWRQIK